jgi:cytochrome c553
MRNLRLTLTVCVVLAVVLVTIYQAQARNPIRRTFFDTYTVAKGTQLDDLPSNAGHCGACHFDFGGGGPRNAYGLGIEVGLNNGLSNSDAILAVEGNDSDADGFTNLTEITDVITFSNTPTFPGLSESNYGSALNVVLAEIEPYLTPGGATDTIPPDVTVTSPNGGESMNADSYFAISFSATDASGVSHINIYLSDDSGLTFKPVATNEPPGTGFSWFVPNRPGTASRIAVEAVDIAGNVGSDMSDGDFTIIARPAGYVPTTLRDVDMPGTQPHEGAILDDPDQSCATCHGNYDSANEPWYTWRGSMMAQAARDPFFFACMAIAEQDAPSVGDICIRCHTPGGWQEGRSVDTSGDLLTAKERHGVHCDYCHRKVDFNYVEGVSPAQDVDVLANISPLPLQYGNGQFINDPAPLMRGPYADAAASHQTVESPFHRSANLCGTCHDVSSPAFNRSAPADYVPNAFDQPHPDTDVRNMFPVERTFSAWSRSAYAIAGVYAPEFAGDKPDGIVSTCQDCHMRDVTAKGCNEPGAPTRSDLALHDMMGGNTFVPEIIASYFPDEVDVAQLQAAVLRARAMLQKAATLELTPEDFGVAVRVTNQCGHKLPSGYPEGRRVWLNIKAYDGADQLVFESGAYDLGTAELSHDADLKIYEIHPGTSPALGALIGFPAGKSFHFVLSDTVYFDNRIPPRGFTNANFEDIQSAPVDYAYADFQYWDDTQYFLPETAESVDVTLYYQSTSKEYIEFLRDENTTNSAGQDLYDAWVAQGKCPPEIIAQASTGVTVTSSVKDDPQVPLVYSLSQNYPNPFGPATTITYSLARKEHVHISVYDPAGRHIRTLVDEIQEPSRYRTEWVGTNSRDEQVPPGVYFIRYRAGSHAFTKKAIVLK